MKLFGKNPVKERIISAPGSILKLYLQKRTDLSDIVLSAKEAGLDFDSVEKEKIEKMCPGMHTQGVVAEVQDFIYFPFTGIVDLCLNKSSIPVFLDSVTDPQNIGSIIRNLACMGGFSLVLPEHGVPEVNETVLRVANGGENHIKISRVTNIATAISKIKEKGILVAGAVLDQDSVNVFDADLALPLAVVIGAEGKGIRPGVLKHLDIMVKLPMDGAELSYNASVATALLCYELVRRRSRK